MNEEKINVNPSDAVMNCHRRCYKDAGRLVREVKISADDYTEFRTVFKDAFSIRKSIIALEEGYRSGARKIEEIPVEAIRLLKKIYPNICEIRISDAELDSILRSGYNTLIVTAKVLMEHLWEFYKKFADIDSSFNEKYLSLIAEMEKTDENNKEE